MANYLDATGEASQVAIPSKLPPDPLLKDSSLRPSMMQHTGCCKGCYNLDLCYEKGRAAIEFNISLEKLREGSEMGCVYCKIMCTSRTMFATEIPHEVSEVSVFSYYMSPYFTKFRWRWPEGPKTRDWPSWDNFRDIRFQISLCQQARPWGRFQTWHGIPSSARSNETVSFCRNMLRKCLASHEKCQYGQGWHPTRLLFVGDGVESIRLIKTPNTYFHRYAALSHPWGTSQSLALKSTNEALMTHLIAWDTLPQTYRDAIWFCQTLGVDYLWIDSLCIKQDDNQEWHREAAKMADVYENALIVIAASCCRSTEDSFLDLRMPVACGPAVVAWSNDSEPRPVLQIQKIPKTGFHLPKGLATTDPLDMRAWAFQEKKLAKRLINFTNGEVQWTCKSACFCECPEAWNNFREVSGHSVPATMEEWQNAMTDYSGLHLTYPSDKLPALSGLAARFHQVHGFKYLAGLWHNSELVKQLAWRQKTDQMSTGNDHGPAYRAPTFSWASINARVVWDSYLSDEYFQAHIEVRDAQCMLKSSNPFGEAIDGYIRIRGRVLGLLLHQPATQEGQPSLSFANGDRLELFFYPDNPTGQNYFRRKEIPAESEIRLQRSIQWLAKAEGFLPDCIDVVCLRIFNFGIYECDSFLVLVESSYVPGAYERIGLIWTLGDVAEGEQAKASTQLLDCWNSTPIEEFTIV